MNKYQEALELFVARTRIEAPTYGNFKGKKEINLLQKLVDRATPKKPNGTNVDPSCPNCDSDRRMTNRVSINKFCGNCGQALDWSE